MSRLGPEDFHGPAAYEHYLSDCFASLEILIIYGLKGDDDALRGATKKALHVVHNREN